MSKRVIQRRSFLKTTVAGAAAVAAGGYARTAMGGVPLLGIDEPFHGAVLNHRHGKQADGALQIEVSGQAPLDDRVAVNGIEARRAGTRFVANVALRDKETDLVAVSNGRYGRQEHRIRVVWDKNSFPRYRFSIDDNIFFLRDIAQKNYASLFDCFYLAGLRDLNKKYGARFSVNVFYSTGNDFQLSQFPDRYRSEWKDNAHWLKLAFHAQTEHPDRPYQYASPQKLLADLDQVAAEIHRFAGEEAYAPPTVIHWGMVQPASLKPLYERGVRTLSGYFGKRQGGYYDVNYLVDEVRSEYLSRHDALKDFDSGIVFSRIDIVCNSTPIDKTVPTLEPLSQDPNQAEIMDLFTHEQYFWPFYSHYVPDHFQRLDKAIAWVTDRGYKPVFLHEGFLGAPE